MQYLKDEAEKEAKLWMNKAARTAEQALCHRAKCGAVIVRNGEVIGVGYNAPPQDKEENRMCEKEFVAGRPKYDKTCCMHAEWRAILSAIRTKPEKLGGSKLYFTRVDEKGGIIPSGEPFCTVCSRFALDVGIDKFVLWHDEGIFEYPTEDYNRLSYAYVPGK
jgi:deoxycytidylate deaminase